MFMNINAIKVFKFIDICAIIYDLLYWIKNKWKKMYLMIFFFIYIHLNGKKLPTSERTDATPDARLLVHLVKPSKKILFQYCQRLTLDISAMSFHYNSLT